MTSQSRTRVLAWEACLNARDLGGYPAAGGRETTWGAVVRADTLSRLTATGLDTLIAHGVNTVIDLRLPAELVEAPNPFAPPGCPGVSFKNISLIDPAAAPPPEYATLADDYKGMLVRFAPQFAAVFESMASAPPGGIVVHCAAGKDRTGLVSALLLSLAGVSPMTIAADYALSAEQLREVDQRWLESEPEKRAEREQQMARWIPRVEVMTEVLDHLDARHGGAEPYLRACGVRPTNIERVRARMLGAPVASV